MDVRQPIHSDHVRTLDTEGVRRHFLVDRLFVPDELALICSQIDRVIVGGAMPVRGPVGFPPARFYLNSAPAHRACPTRKVSLAEAAPLRAEPARSAEILARIPAGRWGEPSDLDGAIVFLASSASDYVHGATLAVDGGWLARWRNGASDPGLVGARPR